MRKKALYKDIGREIKKTLGRFISIVLLIAIGVLAFTGLRITGLDMLFTTADYMAEFKVADAIIQSTYGLNADDVAIIESLDNVRVSEYAYQEDVIVQDIQRVMRVHSLPETLTTLDVKLGRLPEGPNEIAVDYIQLKDTYKLGDTLSFVDGSNKPATEHLHATKFTIVGFVQSPDYLVDGMRGNTTLGSGVVDAFGVIAKDVFNFDIYTSALLQFESTQGLAHYSKEFEENLAVEMEKVEKAFEGQPEIRLQKLKKEILAEITDAEKELADAEEELARAAREIQEGAEELANGEADYQEGVATFEEEIGNAQALIIAAQTQLAEGRINLDTAKESLTSAGVILASERAKLEAADGAITKGLTEVATGKAEIDAGIIQLSAGILALEQAKAEIDASLPELEVQHTEALAGQAQLILARDTLLAEIAALEAATQPIPESLLQALAATEEQLQILTITITELAQVLEEASTGFPTITAQIQALAEQKSGLEQQLSELQLVEAGLLAQQKQVAAGFVQLVVGETQLQASWDTIAQEEQRYRAGIAELATQETIFVQERERGAAKLVNARALLADGQRALDEARALFASEQPEALRKIADGRADLRDARAEMDDLQKPQYMVQSIANAQSYTMITESTQGLDVLGIVFPLFVFFVAALVCLTTMTRMVEEQRMLIGTMKQLGYNHADIRKKYSIYAFASSTVGVLLGLYLGHVILPSAVFTAYETMFSFSKFSLQFSWFNSALSFLIAYACTVGITYYITGSLLRDNTATLLRGAAPVNGSRILLERLPFIWKRISFTYKVTFRNLFRYKQRMFMTIIGVAGCTALIMMGIGLHDSIASLGYKQFVGINQYDIMVMVDNTSDELADLEQLLVEDTAVTSVTPIHMEIFTSKVDGLSEQDIQIIVPEDAAAFAAVNALRNRQTKEPLDLATSEIIVTEKLMKMFQKEIGDTLTLKSIDTTYFDITPVAMTEEYTQHKIYMTKAAYEKVFGESYLPNGFTITLKDGSTAAEETFANKLQQNKAVTMLFKTSTFEEQVDNVLGSLQAVFFIIIFLASLLATVVLYNLTNINVAERMRELSTIKVLGFYNREVTLYIYRESIILTLIGIALGFIPGKMLHTYICFSLPQGGTMFPLDITWQNYALTTCFVILVSLGVMLVMHQKIKKVDMVEALKSVE